LKTLIFKKARKLVWINWLVRTNKKINYYCLKIFPNHKFLRLRKVVLQVKPVHKVRMRKRAQIFLKAKKLLNLIQNFTILQADLKNKVLFQKNLIKTFSKKTNHYKISLTLQIKIKMCHSSKLMSYVMLDAKNISR